MAELRRTAAALTAEERGRRIEDPTIRDSDTEPVMRGDGNIDLAGLDGLYGEFMRRVGTGEWGDRAASDRWLAPRLHRALRLSRAEASDRGLWQWLAVRANEYVRWRWAGADGSVVDARWWGPIHKQALARLWWGAELFRDGADYTPVERAFVRQDLPNSLLHRPLVRCRSLALGIVETLAPQGSDTASAAEVNDLARALNLATAGSPPEAETGYRRDGVAAYRQWITESVDSPTAWDDLPAGPTTEDTTQESRTAGRRIAERGRRFAETARTYARKADDV